MPGTGHRGRHGAKCSQHEDSACAQAAVKPPTARELGTMVHSLNFEKRGTDSRTSLQKLSEL